MSERMMEIGYEGHSQSRLIVLFGDEETEGARNNVFSPALCLRTSGFIGTVETRGSVSCSLISSTECRFALRLLCMKFEAHCTRAWRPASCSVLFLPLSFAAICATCRGQSAIICGCSLWMRFFFPRPPCVRDLKLQAPRGPFIFLVACAAAAAAAAAAPAVVARKGESNLQANQENCSPAGRAQARRWVRRALQAQSHAHSLPHPTRGTSAKRYRSLATHRV
jgi:hypothetical protein